MLARPGLLRPINPQAITTAHALSAQEDSRDAEA